MDWAPAAEDEALRSHLRALVAEHLPEGFPGIFVDDLAMYEATARFCRVLAGEGLLTLSWPREYGGQDATPWRQLVFREEMWGHNEPTGPQYMGVNWIGPAIMRFGTEAQRATFLPRIAAGEIVWCQGFSEPGAGSDLAALQLRATACDGGWTLDGQKIWTSYADLADHCILAARTTTGGPKQHGITVFLLPMDRAGVEVRPIDTMLGPHHFNELFLTGVPVGPDEVLGEVDSGWEVMSAGLSYERTGNPRYARSAHILSEVTDVLARRAEAVPGGLAARVAAALVHTRVAQLLNHRVVAGHDAAVAGHGELPRRESQLARIASTTLDQEVADVVMDAEGALALLGHDPELRVGSGDAEHHWRYAQTSTVTAGTLEIQKMLLARSEL